MDLDPLKNKTLKRWSIVSWNFYASHAKICMFICKDSQTSWNLKYVCIKQNVSFYEATVDLFFSKTCSTKIE